MCKQVVIIDGTLQVIGDGGTYVLQQCGHVMWYVSCKSCDVVRRSHASHVMW